MATLTPSTATLIQPDAGALRRFRRNERTGKREREIFGPLLAQQQPDAFRDKDPAHGKGYAAPLFELQVGHLVHVGQELHDVPAFRVEVEEHDAVFNELREVLVQEAEDADGRAGKEARLC